MRFVTQVKQFERGPVHRLSVFHSLSQTTHSKRKKCDLPSF